MQVCFSILLQDPPSHLPFSILSPSPLLHSQLRMFGSLLLSLPHFLLPSQTKQAVWKATKLEPQSSPAPQTSPSPPPWQFILNTSVLVSWQCTLFKLHMRPQHAQTTMHAAIHSPNNSILEVISICPPQKWWQGYPCISRSPQISLDEAKTVGNPIP